MLGNANAQIEPNLLCLTDNPNILTHLVQNQESKVRFFVFPWLESGDDRNKKTVHEIKKRVQFQ